MTTATASATTEPVGLHIATPFDTEGIGNSYGYSHMTKRLCEGLAAAPSIRADHNAQLALHFCEPGRFEPIDGRHNVLFSMWESRVLDDVRAWNIKKADALIVPSQFSREVLTPYLRHKEIPVRVVPLGVDLDECPYVERECRPDGTGPVPFMWLWVGAPNARKGFDVIGDTWNAAFVNDKRMLLYMKTSGAEKHGVIEQENVIFDYRSLSRRDIVRLYHAAHGFVFPTAGEGWGLTLQEAMATGLPCITTRYSGVLEFSNPDTVLYANHRMLDVATSEDKMVETAYAEPRSVALCMQQVMTKYRAALRMGKKASRDMRRFTWELSGLKLADAIVSISNTLF